MCAKVSPDQLTFGSKRAKSLVWSKNRERPSRQWRPSRNCSCVLQCKAIAAVRQRIQLCQLCTKY